MHKRHFDIFVAQFRYDFIFNSLSDSRSNVLTVDSSCCSAKVPKIAVPSSSAHLKEEYKCNDIQTPDIYYNDFVIHLNFGVGRYKGFHILEISGVQHECLLIEFYGNDKLYIPVEDLDLMSKYADADYNIILDRLGGVNGLQRKPRYKVK